MSLNRRKAPNVLGPAFAEVMRVERARARLTIDELAQKSGVSRSTIGRYNDAEQVVTMPNLIAISGALGIKPSDFMEMVEDVHENRVANKDSDRS